ncbi:MAG: hypothetical protein KGL10_06880 [Alphaproteobacteria bacterium]|nr:hypothetical protein [Alphaproteobacteria bacterium]MDE2337018.1 hypothetical protein [Alphaproteobacteria bacterium]
MTEYTLIRPRGALGPSFHEAAVLLRTHKDLTVKGAVPMETADGGGVYIVETTKDIAEALPQKLSGWKLVPPRR